jgi:hypothetical protein
MHGHSPTLGISVKDSEGIGRNDVARYRPTCSVKDGERIGRNDVEAVRWFRTATEQR